MTISVIHWFKQIDYYLNLMKIQEDVSSKASTYQIVLYKCANNSFGLDHVITFSSWMNTNISFTYDFHWLIKLTLVLTILIKVQPW